MFESFFFSFSSFSLLKLVSFTIKDEYDDQSEAEIIEAMKHPKTKAWGEIGLDYHPFPDKNYALPDLQKKIFLRQMKHAISLDKPIVIHTREAEEDTLAMMKEFIPTNWLLHVHCFTDSIRFAKELMETFPNLFIGFTGVITFKNASETQKVVREIPLDRLLLETGISLIFKFWFIERALSFSFSFFFSVFYWSALFVLSIKNERKIVK